MSKTYRVLWMVIGGVVGGYIGYWIGDLAGWSTEAEWPLKIGGGGGAIAMSICLAVVGVVIAAVLLPHRPLGLHRR